MNYLYRHLSPRQLLVLGVIVPLIFTAIIGWFIYKSVDDMLRNRDLARHSRSIQFALADFNCALVTAESNQRGYLLTHNDAFLEPYHIAIDSTFAQFKTLRLLTANNALQQHQLDIVEPLLNIKGQLMAQIISLEAKGDHAGALQFVNSDIGRKATTDIVAAIEYMKLVEASLLFQHQSLYQHNFKLNNLVTAISVLFCIGFITAILLMLRQLQHLQSVVTLCALTEMIEYEGGLLTVEDYLKRRQEALTTYGLAQVEAERILGMLDKQKLLHKA